MATRMKKEIRKRVKKKLYVKRDYELEYESCGDWCVIYRSMTGSDWLLHTYHSRMDAMNKMYQLREELGYE